jgi:hypothetical protein
MITLKSNVLKVAKINKSTTAEVFKDLKVGDRILLSIPVTYAGTNTNRGTYASYIKVENLETGQVTYKSFNQLPRFLDYFKFTQGEE